MNVAQPVSEGTLTADINGLEPPLKDSYTAKTVHLTSQFDSAFNQQSWEARGDWSIDGRPKRDLSIVLDVSQDAKTDVSYDLIPDSGLVRAVFVEPLAVGIDPFYRAIKGKVTFTSFPALGSDTGLIEAKFEFVGQNGDPLPKTVTISEGTLRIQN